MPDEPAALRNLNSRELYADVKTLGAIAPLDGLPPKKKRALLGRPLSTSRKLLSPPTRYVLVSIRPSLGHVVLNFLEDLGQTVGRRGLQRGERPVGLELLQP